MMTGYDDFSDCIYIRPVSNGFVVFERSIQLRRDAPVSVATSADDLAALILGWGVGAESRRQPKKEALK